MPITQLSSLAKFETRAALEPVGFRYVYLYECVIEKQAFVGSLKGSW